MSLTVLPNEKPTRTLSEFEYLHNPDSKEARLGKGSFASVKLVKEKSSGALLALKTVDVTLKEASKSDMHNLRMEIQVHRELDHPNIIKFHDYLIEEGKVYMLLDYAPRGNLYTYMHKTKTLPLDKVFKFFYQTCLSVAYLHGKDILHRDLKPENLLLDKDLNIKLCDFGWAARSIKDKRTTFCGTYEYMAPELVAKSTYNYKVDIWSLGILLYELFHSEAPFKGRSLSDIQASMARETIHYNPVIHPELKDLIARILQKDPEQRPELPEILNHPWVRSNLAKSELQMIPSIAELCQPDQQQSSQSQNQISSQNSIQNQDSRAQTAPSAKDQRHRAVSTPHHNLEASMSAVKKTPFAALHRQISDNSEAVKDIKEKEIRETKETRNNAYITAGQKLQVAYSSKEFAKPVPLGYSNALAERPISGLGLSTTHKNYSEGHSLSLQSDSASKLTKGLNLQLGKALKNGTKNMENEFNLTPEKEQNRAQEPIVNSQISRSFLRNKLTSERSLTKENTQGHNQSVTGFGNTQTGFTSTRHAYTTTNNMYGASNSESFSQALGLSHEYKSASKINNSNYTKDYGTKEPLSASTKLPSRTEYTDISSKANFGSRLKRDGGVKLDVQKFYPFGANNSGSVVSPQHSFEASSAGLSTSKTWGQNKSSVNTSASHYTFNRADSDTRLNYPNFGSFTGSYNYGQNSYKGTSSPLIDKQLGKDVREGGYKVSRSNTYMDMRGQGKGSFLA